LSKSAHAAGVEERDATFRNPSTSTRSKSAPKDPPRHPSDAPNTAAQRKSLTTHRLAFY
jgi:hypothetical protein